MPQAAAFAKHLHYLAGICPVDGPTLNQAVFVASLGLGDPKVVGKSARRAVRVLEGEYVGGGRFALINAASLAYKQAAGYRNS